MSSEPKDPSDFFDRSEDYEGWGEITKVGGGAILLGMIYAFIDGINVLIGWLFLPFEVIYDITLASAENFIIVPMETIIPQTAQASADAVMEWLGLGALPVGVGVVLVTFVLVVVFLSLSISGNFLPGTIGDFPLWDLFTSTPEEEGDEEG